MPVDILDLPVGQQRYALFTDEQGGILDDLMVANLGDCLLLVVNAACKHQDLAHLHRHLEGRCSVEPLFEECLARPPGTGGGAGAGAPGAAGGADDLHAVRPRRAARPDCYVSRSGYTGEDGYEISVPAAHAEALARRLLAEPEVAPIGLGARDSLRLEAGLCRYWPRHGQRHRRSKPARLGHFKARRADGARRRLPGAERIFAQQAQGVASKRVGFLPQGRMPVRGAPRSSMPRGGRSARSAAAVSVRVSTRRWPWATCRASWRPAWAAR